MTALAGLWRLDGRPDAAEGCARMLAVQELYGPHHGAQWSDGAVALGRRLMRLLPEDEFDRQPLTGNAARYILVADVRLDNRNELIEALGIQATQARTLCDGAILLAAIERWHEFCFEHLLGDYAFAAWDCSRRRLLLARDPCGHRPLHYHRANRFFAFASMPKGLHALADVPYAPDQERVAEFLAGIPAKGAESFFLGIERVEPGHFAIVSANGFTSRRHWQPSGRRITFPRREEYSEALRDLLDKAVACRLRGASDVGAYLSGGLDSGAVVATAARLLAPTGRRVVALTAVPRDGYNGPAHWVVDEGPNAAATAALYPNVEHVLVRNEGRSPLASLDQWFFLNDRPVNAIFVAGWSHSLNSAIRNRRLSVMLGGGYGNLGLSYAGIELLPELLSRGRWWHLWREASALVAARRLRWRGVLASTFGPWCPPALWNWLYRLSKGGDLEIGALRAINRQLSEELDLPGRAKARSFDLFFRPHKDGVAARLDLLLRGDPGNIGKGRLALMQVDVREPLSDVRLLDFCLAVPTSQFLRDGTMRVLAREALADRLPKQVLEPSPRPVLHVSDWHEDLTAARDSVFEELDRLEACPAATATLDLPRLRRLTEHWPSDGWEREDVRVPYRYTLLNAIAVGHFLRRATGSNR
jgi:asparagine synthase (glutamine-hydrolysing)